MILSKAVPLPSVEIAQASFPSPFSATLEYSAPARGPWTIMHLGLLVPETHIIFVCAQCCLRGVVMSAAELGALDRFSTITIEDCNLLEGDTEEVLIQGVDDILKKIPYKPKAVLLYTSCVHEFIGTDLTFTFDRLREQHPDIDFTDCYMTPILRKRLSPDARNRRQIYTLLKAQSRKDEGISIYGDINPLGQYSDVAQLIYQSKRPLRSITATQTYEEYQALAKSSIALALNPVTTATLKWAQESLGQQSVMLSNGFSLTENRLMLENFSQLLGVKCDLSVAESYFQKSLKKAKEIIQDTSIAIDYTATTRPLSLARFLIENGFNVQALYLDQFMGTEKNDYEWLKKYHPTLRIYPTVHPGMTFARPSVASKTLAIGQKASYFTNTDYFVNLIEGGGMDGISGTARLLELMTEAYLEKKDSKKLIQIKALGCTRRGRL